MKNLNDVDFIQYVGKLEAQYLMYLSDSSEDVIERFGGSNGNFGDVLPWEKTHDNFRFRPSEITLWCGINGHGKSMILSHVVAHLCKSTTCLIASLEMSIGATGHRMVRQMVGTDNPTTDIIDKSLMWLDDKLWFMISSTR